MTPEIQKRVQEWLDGPYDEKTKAEIRTLSEEELTERFSSGISFGTGGMRALMGVGTSRMNIYTVGMATQGLALYLLKNVKTPSVLIGYDSRHHSRLFAEEAARVLAGNGIHVFFLKELRPTPFISFTCRHKQCSAAIMITASHNAKEYNGYKVYWSDGAQVVFPHDTGIMEEVRAVTSVSKAPFDSPLIEQINGSLDNAYLDAIRPLQHFPEENKRLGPTLKIAYTSLHGTGITIVPQALQDWGFSSLCFVAKQIVPDGDFPTVKIPNPEYKETLQLGIDTLVKEKADILLASDPDADRLAVVAWHHEQPVILNGNEIASLCVHYLCEQNKLPPNGAFVTTIVSTELIKTIALSYNKACFEVLTGFKYIGEKIHEWELSKEYTFLFGAEESYGYLLGTHARDKDAIVSSCLLAEIALYAKRAGKTLIDLLDTLYQHYGIFREGQLSIPLSLQQMTALMENLRTHPPQTFCQLPVTLIEDYQSGIRHNLQTGVREKLTLPPSDVLLLRLSDASKLVIRPSGTEPKLKIYAGVHHKTGTIPESDARVNALLAAAQQEIIELQRNI